MTVLIESPINPPLNEQRRIVQTDSSLVGAARRAASEIGARIPFVATRVGREALIATELASNLLKHAHDGELLMRALGDDGRNGLELLAIDRGPGIRNLAEAMRDGMSSAGSSGNGLGAIRRMTDIHDIDTRSDQGTVVMARLYADPSSYRAPAVAIGAVCQPKPMESRCGDAWAAVQTERGCRIIVADGLGHGEFAAVAAQTAINASRAERQASPADFLEFAHRALRSTRGAAVLVVDIDLARGELRYAGVGNIAGVVAQDGATRNLVSHNGTVGHEMRKVQEFSMPWSNDSLLILHSDGLTTKWSLDHYKGLASRHPSIVAATLYRDFRRQSDDVTVVVATNETKRWATSF